MPALPGALRQQGNRGYYEVDSPAKLVTVRAVGYKDHNVLLMRGKAIPL
jgi:hypothetical protein